MRDWKTHNVEIAMTPELSTGEMVVERADQANIFIFENNKFSVSKTSSSYLIYRFLYALVSEILTRDREEE